MTKFIKFDSQCFHNQKLALALQATILISLLLQFVNKISVGEKFDLSTLQY